MDGKPVHYEVNEVQRKNRACCNQLQQTLF